MLAKWPEEQVSENELESEIMALSEISAGCAETKKYFERMEQSRSFSHVQRASIYQDSRGTGIHGNRGLGR